MLMMRALWGPPWRRKKPRKKKPFTGGTRGSAALASGLINSASQKARGQQGYSRDDPG